MNSSIFQYSNNKGNISHTYSDLVLTAKGVCCGYHQYNHPIDTFEFLFILYRETLIRTQEDQDETEEKA